MLEKQSYIVLENITLYDAKEQPCIILRSVILYNTEEQSYIIIEDIILYNAKRQPCIELKSVTLYAVRG